MQRIFYLSKLKSFKLKNAAFSAAFFATVFIRCQTCIFVKNAKNDSFNASALSAE